MSDRELLELAAEAADLCVLPIYGHTDGKLYDASGKEWNPLTDDGDALRLAVKLGIHIGPSPGNGKAIAYNHEHIAEECYGADKNAAARRAIVRAAAEIGKQMSKPIPPAA